MGGYRHPTPHLRTLRQFDHGKGAFQILFDGFFPLKGRGGYPPSLTKVFLQKYCPQREGREYPPTSQFCYKKTGIFDPKRILWFLNVLLMGPFDPFANLS